MSQKSRQEAAISAKREIFVDPEYKKKVTVDASNAFRNLHTSSLTLRQKQACKLICDIVVKTMCALSLLKLHNIMQYEETEVKQPSYVDNLTRIRKDSRL